MKLKVDDEVVLEITENDLTLLKSYIPEEILVEDIKRRVSWVISHLLDMSFVQFKLQWEPQLQMDVGVSSLPKERNDYVKLVVSRSYYKSKSKQNKEAVDRMNRSNDAFAATPQSQGPPISPAQGLPISPIPDASDILDISISPSLKDIKRNNQNKK
jgi:hypothetical protein